MNNDEPIFGIFVDALTGEQIVRELTVEEIEKISLPKKPPTEE